MALTKSSFSVQASATNAAAATTTATGVDLTGAYGAVLGLRITNGATGPTLPAQVTVEYSPDNSSWYDFAGPFVAGTANSGVYEWSVELPLGIGYVRTKFTGNTAQDVTIEAVGTKVTAL